MFQKNFFVHGSEAERLLSYYLGIEKEELEKHSSVINLIASENYVSAGILRLCGSFFTNKYAEGTVGNRFYAGCGNVDKLESMTVSLGKKLFGAEFINVQPHSGSSANLAAYFSILNPGDTILSMSLVSGGHLSHGHVASSSSKIFNFVHYSVSPNDELIDYDEIATLADQHKPKLLIAGASAYSRKIDFRQIFEIAKLHRAFFMADIAHIAGLIAAGIHENPVPFADLVTGTTHKTLRGPRGAFIISKADFADKVNKAVMPGLQGGPLMHLIAAKGLAFAEAMSKDFVEYQKQVVKNARRLAEKMSEFGFRIVSGGTDTHLFLVDLRNLGISGKQMQVAAESAGILVNSNPIPSDKSSPKLWNGIRIGTAAITTRGFSEEDMDVIANFLKEISRSVDDEKRLKRVANDVALFSRKRGLIGLSLPT
jgi:glycine hydroxymethyltransferase